MADAPVTTPAPTDAPVPIMTDAPVTAPVAKPIDNGGKGMRDIGDMGRGKKGGGGTMGMGKRRGLHPSTTDADVYSNDEQRLENLLDKAMAFSENDFSTQ
jgi:hypothetical protein